MPIYEYQCSQCNDRHEAIQGINDAPLAQCAKCGGDLKKLFSSPAIQFKGSGFYKTDYPSSTARAGSSAGGTGKSDGSKSEGGSGSDAGSSSSESKSETKAESKTETKSESSSSKPDAKAAS
jgi:putative FmdB family regulatory protein